MGILIPVKDSLYIEMGPRSMLPTSDLINTFKTYFRGATWLLNSCCPTVNISCPDYIPSWKISKNIKTFGNLSSCHLGDLRLKIVLPPMQFVVGPMELRPLEHSSNLQFNNNNDDNNNDINGNDGNHNNTNDIPPPLCDMSICIQAVASHKCHARWSQCLKQYCLK